MQYLLLLCSDERDLAAPGSTEEAAEFEGYAAFDELAGSAIVGGEALHDNASCRTLRHEGGTVRVTAGPFAETVEGVGGVYVLEAPSLDDVLELARHLPAIETGGIEIRPLVQWFDRTAELGDAPAGAGRWFATIHGPETEADQPGTPAWDAGAAAHGEFVAGAGAHVLAGGALQPRSATTTARVRDGELLVTDGPYAEAIEVVGGFYVLRGSDAEVDAVAGRIPVEDGGAVQLRRIMELDG